MARPSNGCGVVDPRSFAYAPPSATTFQEVTLRQLTEDLNAYKYDLDYCNRQLNDMGTGLTGPETRTFQLRVLDLGHQIRHCQHKMELLQLEMRSGGASTYASPSPVNMSMPFHQQQQQAHRTGAMASARSTNNGSIPQHQQQLLQHQHAQHQLQLQQEQEQPSIQKGRPKSVKRSPVADDDHDPSVTSSSAKRMRHDDPVDEEANTAVQRLGFWNCRLCTSDKYLSAGPGRLPGAPCKWPLRDVAKMIAHFTELHTEHTPAERCVELGDALDRNRKLPCNVCLAK